MDFRRNALMSAFLLSMAELNGCSGTPLANTCRSNSVGGMGSNGCSTGGTGASNSVASGGSGEAAGTSAVPFPGGASSTGGGIGGVNTGGAAGSKLLLAEVQVWHGSPSHGGAFFASWLPNERVYDSRDLVVIQRQIAGATAMGIQGFVVDWYGPAGNYANTSDRAFMDDATKALFSVAEATGFHIALLYDEGAVSRAFSQDAGALHVSEYQDLVKADLAYAQSTYFSSPAYLHLGSLPAVFVFPYGDVDPKLDWSAVRAALNAPVTLIDQDPNPDDSIHDSWFDGFFAWVQPSSSGWADDGQEWGHDYLTWFYGTMKSPSYSSKIAIGGVWPGFDDSLVRWGPGGKPRYMARAGTQVYDQTLALADESGVGVVMIDTLNDFEEGTDVEFGVEMAVDMGNPAPEILIRSSPLQVVWDAALGDGELQVYKNGNQTPIYANRHSPGTWLSLLPDSAYDSPDAGYQIPEAAYEIKVWTSANSPLAKTIKIRREDPVPGITPIAVEP